VEFRVRQNRLGLLRLETFTRGATDPQVSHVCTDNRAIILNDIRADAAIGDLSPDRLALLLWVQTPIENLFIVFLYNFPGDCENCSIVNEIFGQMELAF